jgi:CHAT domain-containing protein/lipopolysaccharide biosynthesis regulator YciM
MRRYKTPSRRNEKSFLCLLLAVLLMPAPIAGRQAEKLEAGKKVERELKGGQSHTYQLALASGQFVRVTIEQKSIDIALSLRAPNGAIIEEADGASVEGTESIAAIAEQSGAYLLEARANGKAAGIYSISIEIRTATEGDRHLVSADRAIHLSEKLRQAKTAEGFRQAASKLEEAVALLKQTDESVLIAATLRTLGAVYRSAGEREKALAVYAESLSLFRQSGNDEQAALVLRDMGAIYRSMQQIERAIELYTEALKIHRARGDREKESDLLYSLGVNYDDLNEWGKALACLEDSLAISRELGDLTGQAFILSAISFIYINKGDSESALYYLDEAHRVFVKTGSRHGQAMILGYIGNAYLELGQYEKSFESLNRALDMHKSLSNINGEGGTLDGLGKVYAAMGDYDRALDYFTQALESFRRRGIDPPTAPALNALGKTHYLKGEIEKAIEYLNESLRLRISQGDKNGEAITRANLSLAERERGNIRAAREHIETAIKIIEDLRVKGESEELRASYLARFQRSYETWIDLVTGDGRDSAKTSEALEISERARARTLLESLRLSGVNIRQGVAPELLIREREVRNNLNTKDAQLKRLLSGRHTEEQAAAARKGVEEARTAFQELKARIREASPKYAALTQPVPLTLREIQQQALDPDSLLLEYFLGERRSYLWAVTSTTHTFHLLPRRAEIEAAALRFYESLTARNKKVAFETKDERRERISRADAEQIESGQALSRMILAPVADQLKNRRLLIVADSALQYIPFAALPAPETRRGGDTATRQQTQGQTISASPRPPLAASYAPLISDHEIVSLPSASALAVLRQELKGRAPAQKMMAVMADPVFDLDDERLKIARASRGSEKSTSQGRNRLRGNDLIRAARNSAGEIKLARLPFTRREAESILSFAPVETSFKALDFAASREAALSGELSKYRYVHFATHGFLDSLHPELSGVVLSLVDEEGKERDGFLRAHEIYNIDLAADLVVLSGCRTGLGKEIRGEGLVGLTRAFMYAGAARVVISLWDIDDEATAEFMIRFYRSLLKANMTPASALRAAQVSMSKDKRWALPYYWAGFVLQGEPR